MKGDDVPSSFLVFLLCLLLALSFQSFTSGATLPQDEVQALIDIAKSLGKKNWNFTVDPCSGESSWFTPVPANELAQNVVRCNCSATVCHVVSIELRSQSLPGTLSLELVRLPYLQQISLERNYLNGTIPPQWVSMKFLESISLLGNRLTGPIPAELGSITTLIYLNLEDNQFYGNLPPELGNLGQLQRMLLTSNSFYGELPFTFAKLTALKEFRIGGNEFFGGIPNYIKNWTSLDKLVIQGSGLSGPIPVEISFLTNLTDLRISDLDGPDSPFPQLDNMVNLKTLILRSCNITGRLPPYLGNMTKLRNLDLSYNKLSGGIPSSFDSLRKDMYQLLLTGNFLSGQVPDWTQKVNYPIDLSYNNFSIGDLERCQNEKLNLFSSYSMGKKSGISSCLASIPCPETVYDLHINCGGNLIKVGGSKTYDKDSDEAGKATFNQRGENWAVRNTGEFLDKDVNNYFTTKSNLSGFAMANVELYMDARVSPDSITYYGFCMGNGKYAVNLHFAEIMFSADETYSSLGKRLFDIYIQGKLAQKDFDIVKEAGGVGKAVIKKFTAFVTSNNLAIHLYWAGKGTTAIPFRSVYGPLISAISVDLEKGSSIPTGAVIAIVTAGVIVVILVFGLIWWRCCLEQKNLLARELKGFDLQTGFFTLREIKEATNSFDIAYKIGEGGFGPVYKGVLSDGRVIAVKKLSSESRQGNREFINEIGIISALQHPCLVKLYGCCMEGDELLLIYEYMENNSLAHALFGREECQINLDWPTRYKICIGIARGLAYLHEESRLKIVHRDIKATNVLLDKDFNPKIADFGLAKLDEENNTHISTRIAGTYGYMAPEYAMHGYLTEKADIYSFGIVALEVLSGKSSAPKTRAKKECFSLLDWSRLLKGKGNLMELVDQRLGADFNKEEVMVMINVALLCTHSTPTLRPTMSSVVSMLEGRTDVQEVTSDRKEVLEVMRRYYRQTENNETSETENLIVSIDETTASTISEKDLYPVNLDSSYWMKRG